MLSNLCADGVFAPCGAFEPGFPELTGLVDHENQIASHPDRAGRGRDPSGWRHGGARAGHYVGTGTADPRRAESHTQVARDASGGSRAARGLRLPVDDKVSIAFAPGGLSVGKENAPLVLVEYTDYQCPFCQRYHNDSFEKIKANFIDTGKIRYVSRDFPLPFHENARRGATAGRCAAEQGKFWELRHTMIVNANQLQADKLGGYAQSASLDVPKFQACVDSDKFKAAIDKDIAEGSAAGINGTPSFVLGRLENGKLQGVRMVGAMPYAQFEAKIQDMLKQTARTDRGVSDNRVTCANARVAFCRCRRCDGPRSRGKFDDLLIVVVRCLLLAFRSAS